MPSMLSVMPNVIEKSARTVVMHGGLDFRLLPEGTRCVVCPFKNFYLYALTRAAPSE